MAGINLTPDTPEMRRLLNRVAREQLKKRLLADVLMDMKVCEIEGWDKLEFINELMELLAALGKKQKGGGERWN